MPKSMVLERDGVDDGFAQRFGWVLPEGSLVFIEGKEGSGKSVLCQRLCYSFLRNGYTCSYLSTQFTVKNFVRQTASIGYDMKRYLLEGSLFFVSTESTIGETLPKKTFLDRFLTFKKLFDPEIIFIDSISNLLHESLSRDNLIDLFNFFNRWKGVGKIIIVTANPNEWDEYIHQNFKVNCDVHFELAVVEIPGIGPVNNVYIHKFNGAQH